MLPPSQRQATPRPRLRERYSFDNYIVGPGNRLAFAAAEGIAQTPGQLYNPLFLYGAAGLGKTHLLHAVGHSLVSRKVDVVLISAEAFTNQLITAIQQRTMDEFRARYRSAETLLMDDIQFIAGKEQTQEEFFYTFNELYETGHQIVITSDKSPVAHPAPRGAPAYPVRVGHDRGPASAGHRDPDCDPAAQGH